MDPLDAVLYNKDAIIYSPQALSQAAYNITSGAGGEDEVRYPKVIPPSQMTGGSGMNLFSLGGLGSMAMGAVSGALGVNVGGSSGTKRRRRRSGLTKRNMSDILFIKDAVGKTAAANYINLIRGR